jgi:nucleoside-diphosphate-sugar epimerase
MTKTVLVVGATGMLGSKITHNLPDAQNTRVRLLIRGENRADKKDLLTSFLDRGDELVEGTTI